jgi:anti-anti-sigma factor
MKIKTQDYNDVTVIELQGEFDGEYAEQFEAVFNNIVANGRVGAVIDMSNVAFIDSEGLERLLWARDHCAENGCQLKLAVLDDNCAKILEITRLENEFDRYSELAEAVRSFA